MKKQYIQFENVTKSYGRISQSGGITIENKKRGLAPLFFRGRGGGVFTFGEYPCLRLCGNQFPPLRRDANSILPDGQRRVLALTTTQTKKGVQDPSFYWSE